MKLAWVTGASSGIGLAISKTLLEEGWRVRGIDRASAAFEQADYSHSSLDLSDAPSLQTWLDAMTELPDALIHAAGLMHTAPLGALDAQASELMWKVHVQAAAILANHVLPRMQAAKRGRMILIGSRVASGMPGRSQYAATKAALLSNTRSWAAEVIASGVTVNLISPAATDTPMLQGGNRTSSTPRLPPIGRLIAPQEIADLAAFLLSDKAAAITGQDIAVCGGASLPK